MDKGSLRGFTLIELATVLVVIGLVVGGVLVGRSLIDAATVRAQISQIEKYNTAVNTFRDKYGALPGDICNPLVTQFGFVARAGGRGRGDCNGTIEGYYYAGNTYYGWDQGGETLFFWEDLSSANLIDGSFSSANDAQVFPIISSSGFNNYLPTAKVGGGNYLIVYSLMDSSGALAGAWVNYFGLSVPTSLNSTGNLSASPGLTVAQAFTIDNKIDDGLPLSGRAVTNYINGSGALAASPNSSTSSVTTCYDTTSNQYSMSQNGGAGVNCALSFRFQ